MIEVIIRNYLKEKLSIPVCLEKPMSQFKEYVLIEKVGSGNENHIHTATIAVQSISTTLYKAAALNEKIKKEMEAMPYETEVSKAKLNNDYNYTDTTVKEYRYQAVYDLVY